MTAAKPKPMASLDQLREQKLTVQEVRKILGVSVMTVYRMCESGELRSYRIKGKYRIPISAVREYLGEAVVEPRGVES